MTIKDIARLANVSPSTVSRILNDSTNTFARSETRERVWDIVERYGFTLNRSAQELRASSPKIGRARLACFIAFTRRETENPFFYQLSKAIEQAALQHDFSVPYYFTNFTAQNAATTQRVISLSVDGAICVGRFTDTATMSFLEKQYRNIVYVGLSAIRENIDQVICDGFKAASSAMEYLIELGHRSIGYIGAEKNEVRYRAYRFVMNAHHLPMPASNISFCEYDGYSGYSATERLLESASNRPTAIFCGNDSTAVLVIDCLKSRGLSVPQDISIVSVDGISSAQMSSPALTTICLPVIELSHIAIEVLESRIIRHRKIPIKVEVPFQFFARDTVREIR